MYTHIWYAVHVLSGSLLLGYVCIRYDGVAVAVAVALVVVVECVCLVFGRLECKYREPGALLTHA